VIIVTNEALASRRRRQAALMSVTGFLVLLLGLAANMLGLRAGGPDRAYVLASYAGLVVGSILSWVGMSLSDRWTLPPRADEALGEALKGAGRGYRLYNWALPADHVLLAPWGLLVLVVFNSEGPVVVEGSRWRDKRPAWRKVLGLGRRPVRHPGRLLELDVDALRTALTAQDEALADVVVATAAVFIRPGLALSVTDPDLPAMRADEMRDWVRQPERGTPLAPGDRRRIERALEAISAARLAAEKKPARRKARPRAPRG
jgi:hypothetical protein